MKNILLLTDFSKNSINALRYALTFFEDELCNFFILHVEVSTSYIIDDLVIGGNQSIYDTLVKKSKHKLAKLVTKLENEFKNKNYNFEILVDHDVLPDAINQVVALKAIDLIVMGTNGVTGAKEVVFGSNTINVIRKVDCPTLVIPEDFKYKKPEAVLLPLDPLDSLGENTFTTVLKFTNRFCKKLHILRILPDPIITPKTLQDSTNIQSFIKDLDYEYYTVKNIPMDAVVSCYVQTHQIDLMKLLVQKKSLFERFFMGSSTTQISNKVSVPLLIHHC
ncbi:universal stress protein [uncultured Winogradskyella sp.]|uniref:universal stress protein n=1 Tax=uncultured Winogradskyella sp. TaxID=395353 RepID=UPI0030DB3FE1|tara:strand:- start:107659 stop:108492 length:834 start_codon:yes stop_codon:yes gene_type:complete